MGDFCKHVTWPCALKTNERKKERRRGKGLVLVETGQAGLSFSFRL